MKNFLKIEIYPLNKQQKEILIAELSEIGFYAFEEGEDFLDAYIEPGVLDREKFRQLLPEGVSYREWMLADQDWNEKWENELQPVVIENKVGIRAKFHPPFNNVNYEIIITPKMSFGTGHHATTEMMIRLMLGLDFIDKKVLDFGAGTGVLSILAEKLGANYVDAVDSDEGSVKKARENILINKCVKITVAKSDEISDFEKADIILSNINLNVLLSYAKELSGKTKKGGFLILSGFLVEDAKQVESVYAGLDFWVKKSIKIKEWCAITLQKT